MLFDGHARAESARPLGSLKDNRHHLALAGALTDGIVDFAHHGDVEDVERRARETYAPDAIFDVEPDVLIFVGHQKEV